MKKITSLISLILAIFMLGGCMHKVSDKIPENGIMDIDEVKFPDMNNTWLDGPTMPSLEALRKIEPAMNKDQIMDLIGHPHFSEGLYAVAEWDYLFNLKQNATDKDQICQYKIVFDKNYLARSFFWKPQICADIVNNKNMLNKFELSSDFLFDFGKSNLKPNGKKEISNILSKLEKAKIENIEIIGYTDPIGSEKSNLILSEKRANSVKNEFVYSGIPAFKISVIGMGEKEQIKICDQKMSRSELIECLSPNRRVVINIKASK